MSGLISVKLLGGFGSQCFQYAFARAWAERHGCRLFAGDWVGRHIFELDDPPFSDAPAMPQRDEFTIRPGEVNICISTYASSQGALIYTRTQARAWFKLRAALREILEPMMPPGDEIVAHRRTGDYIQNQAYPLLSRACYYYACNHYGYEPGKLRFVEYETALRCPQFPNPGELEFLPDFYRLMKAPVLFRGNSCFSWWAAVLGEHRAVYSPVIVGLRGGIEHDAEFVPGNAPRIAFPFRESTELELSP